MDMESNARSALELRGGGADFLNGSLKHNSKRKFPFTHK